MQAYMLSNTAEISRVSRDADKNDPVSEVEKKAPPGVVEDAGNDTVPALSMLHLLVVDADAPVLQACCEIGASLGFDVFGASSYEQAHQQMRQQTMDVVLLDLKLPGGGLSLLEEIRQRYPQTTAIVMTAFATVSSAVEAMRIGASDYLTKPFAMEELTTILERTGQRRRFDSESRRLRERLRTQAGLGGMVGRSNEMQKLYRILSKVAFSAHPVLILGESGTGKEMVARAIHNYGNTADQAFMAIDCSAMSLVQIESELFGHVKGSFTGASHEKDGLLAAMDGGTVFLDEIGELPLEVQARLLRSLQEKEVRPIGSAQAVPFRARVLAASNRNLAAMVEQGRFRKDLFFRLNVVNLRIPPLRERREDIPLLVAQFLERVRRESGVQYAFSDEALHVITEYEWPGNVRELENAIERACALSSGPVLHMADLPTQLQDFRMHTTGELSRIDERAAPPEEAIRIVAPPSEPANVDSFTSIVSIAELEKQAILNTIRQLNGDKLMAARLLGIGKTTLYRKLKEYGIE